MTPDERAEAVVDEIRKTRGRYHAITTHEAITLILTALRDERRRGMEEAAEVVEKLYRIDESTAGSVAGQIAFAIREQARREG